MKVLINALSAHQGGIVTYTRNLMESFDKQGIDAVFALPENSPLPERTQDMRFPVQNMLGITRAIWEQTFWSHVVKRHNPSVLYSSANFSLINSPIPQVLLIREAGLFDSLYLENVAPSFGVMAAMQRILRRQLILSSAKSAQCIAVPTQSFKDLLTSNYDSLKDRIIVNHYGLPFMKFSAAGHVRKWRNDGVLRLLFVSEYYPHKQPGLLCEAVRILNERGIKTHVTLTANIKNIEAVSGSSKDVDLLTRAEARGEASLISHIPYDQLVEYYHSHDALVSASLSETFCHPLIEAMYSGLIVVSSDLPVAKEVCGENAEFFDGLRTRSLVESILKLDNDPEYREQLRENGVAFSCDNYDWDEHVNRLLDIFENTIAAGRHRAA